MSCTHYIIERTHGGAGLSHTWFVHLSGEGNEKWTDEIDKARHFEDQEEAVKTTLALDPMGTYSIETRQIAAPNSLPGGTHAKAGQHVPIEV